MNTVYSTNKLKITLSDIVALIMLIIGGFLRFYKLRDFTTFLGDQGRDALVVRDIATFHHFPAIGAPTSVGQIFLGPFYYYLVAPFLLIFRMDPVGMAFGVGLIALLGALAAYVVIKREVNATTALMTIAFFLFSATLVDLSRYSWNPNPLPYFAFFTLFFLTRIRHPKAILYGFLFGSFLSLSIQLHYLALLIIVPCAYLIIEEWIASRKHRDMIKWIGAATCGFVLFISPLILFDLKHQFSNSKSFFTYITHGEATASGSYLSRLHDTLGAFLNYIAGVPVPEPAPWIFGLLILMGVFYIGWREKKSMLLRAHALSVLGYILIFAAVHTQRHYHYYTTIYLSFYFMLSYAIMHIRPRVAAYGTAILVLAGFIFLQWNGYYFILREPNKQVEHAQKVAQVIRNNIGGSRFKLTALPDVYSDSTYRYFLLVLGGQPIDKNSFDKGDILFVVCESTCSPVGDGQWDIAYFAPRRVDKTWKVDGATIYKLSR